MKNVFVVQGYGMYVRKPGWTGGNRIGSSPLALYRRGSRSYPCRKPRPDRRSRA